MPQPKPLVADGVEYVTTEQAAELMGRDVTVDMIQDWVKRGILEPAGREPGRSNIFRFRDVATAELRTRRARTRPRRAGNLPKISDLGHNLRTTEVADATQKPVVTCGIINVYGDACDEDAEPGEPFNVCRYHQDQIFHHYHKTMVAAIRAGGARAVGASSYKVLPPVEKTEYVYYMRLGDTVKIGFSSNVRSRMASVQHEELLAVEPGGRDLEQMRHAQFKTIRIYTNREWFKLTRELASHCKMLVNHYGTPQKVLGLPQSQQSLE